MNTAVTITSRITELVAIGRDCVQRGLTLASGGNFSARVADDLFVVTAAGTWLDRLVPSDFSVMNLAGTVIEGNPTPSSEWKLHQRAYLVRSDVHAVVHVHPQHAVLLDALGHSIRLMTLDHAYYVRSIGRTAYHPNGSDELADSAAEQSRLHDCIVMSHHGCSALGPTVEMAYRRALNLEEAATASYRALLLGDVETTMPADALAALHHR